MNNVKYFMLFACFFWGGPSLVISADSPVAFPPINEGGSPNYIERPIYLQNIKKNIIKKNYKTYFCYDDFKYIAEAMKLDMGPASVRGNGKDAIIEYSEKYGCSRFRLGMHGEDGFEFTSTVNIFCARYSDDGFYYLAALIDYRQERTDSLRGSVYMWVYVNPEAKNKYIDKIEVQRSFPVNVARILPDEAKEDRSLRNQFNSQDYFLCIKIDAKSLKLTESFLAPVSSPNAFSAWFADEEYSYAGLTCSNFFLEDDMIIYFQNYEQFRGQDMDRERTNCFYFSPKHMSMVKDMPARIDDYEYRFTSDQVVVKCMASNCIDPPYRGDLPLEIFDKCEKKVCLYQYDPQENRIKLIKTAEPDEEHNRNNDRKKEHTYTLPEFEKRYHVKIMR